MELLEQIRREMKRQHITEVKMAEKIGISYKAVHKWFKGQTDPSYAHILDMIWILDLDVEVKCRNEH